MITTVRAFLLLALWWTLILLALFAAVGCRCVDHHTVKVQASAPMAVAEKGTWTASYEVQWK